MVEKLTDLEKYIENKLSNIISIDDLKNLRIEIFGKKGLITEHLKSLSTLSENERKVKGKKIT